MPRTMRDQIQNAIATADTKDMSSNSETPDYAAAHASMVELGRKGKLNDSAVNRFAVRGEYTNVVAALAFLTGSSIEVMLPLAPWPRIGEARSAARILGSELFRKALLLSLSCAPTYQSLVQLV